eukprot:Gb_22309 [translate_table: standard]
MEQSWRKLSGGSPRLVLVYWALILVAVRGCSAACPVPTAQCSSEGCRITNYRGEWEDGSYACKAAKVVYPTTEDELIRAVADAVKHGKKIKVMSTGAHSIDRFVCPGGHGSGVAINTRYYNSQIIVDKRSMTVTVDAGVQLRDLIDRLAEEGWALTHSIYWDAVSMAGVVSTAAHGSGLWGKGSAMHEYVVGMSLVVPAPPAQGYAKVIHLKEKDDDQDLKAARVSLGVLGAISQMTFAVEKQFKRSVTLQLKNDFDLEESFLGFATSHEFGDISWYPSFHKVVYRLDDRVPAHVPGDGQYSPAAYRPQTVQTVVQNRATEEKTQVTRNTSRLCQTCKANLVQNLQAGGGFLNDRQTFRGFPVIGFNHMIQASSGCQKNSNGRTCSMKEQPLKNNDTICAWDTQVEGNFYFHTSIAIPLARITEAILDIKALRDLDRGSLCGLDCYLGFQMRYSKKSEDYLGRKADSVNVEFMYYRSRKLKVPRWNEHVMEEIEQMLLQKYGGVPHWGKNRVYTFEGAAKRRVNLEKFLAVKQRFDPHGFFSSEWSDSVLGIGKEGGVERWVDGCALDGLCICNEDRHCAPEHGFVCRPGRIWNKARICIEEKSLN